MPDHRKPRVIFEAPKPLAAEFIALATDLGPGGAPFLYAWSIAAARVALAGHGHLLPPIRSESVGPDPHRFRFAMNPAEQREVIAAIRDAGSSLRACLHSAMQDLVDHGSALRMTSAWLAVPSIGP